MSAVGAATLMTPSGEPSWIVTRTLGEAMARSTSTAWSGARHCNRNVSLAVALGATAVRRDRITKTRAAAVAILSPIRQYSAILRRRDISMARAASGPAATGA